MFDDCLRTADRLTTYRQICAQVAREFNLIACFKIGRASCRERV